MSQSALLTPRPNPLTTCDLLGKEWQGQIVLSAASSPVKVRKGAKRSLPPSSGLMNPKPQLRPRRSKRPTFILEKLLHKPSGHGYIAAAGVLQLPLTDIQFPSLLALRRPVHTDQPDGWQAQQCTRHQSAWFHQISGHTTLQA